MASVRTTYTLPSPLPRTESLSAGGNVRKPDVHNGVRLLLLRLLLQSINELLVRGEYKSACLHVTDDLVGSVRLLRGIVALDGLC